MKKKYLPYLFMLPALLFIVFIYGGPIVTTVFLSLTDWNGIGKNMNFIGFQNFISLMNEKDFLNSFTNTFLYSFCTLVVQNIFGITIALFLNKAFRGRDLCRAFFFLPAILSIFAVGKIWEIILNPIDGPLIVLLTEIGLHGLAEIRWLADPNLALYTVILVNIWQWTGWNMVVYLAGLQTIPDELLESAQIDGAKRVRMFFAIMLPLLTPAITVNVIMTTIGGIKVFDLPFSLTKGGPGYASETLMMSIVRNSFALNKFGYGAAMSVIMFLFIIIVAVIQLRSISSVEKDLL